MKKTAGVFAAIVFTALSAASASAGPSRALIQEMGSTTAKEEVNVDLDVVSHSFNVVSANDTTLGAGNATVGGTTVSSVNVNLIENIEVRIGRLPGFRSYLTLPTVAAVALNPAPNNYGLTVKGSIPQVPGLAAWLGYGSISEANISTAAADTADMSGSSMRLGAAYTWAGPVVLNGALGYGKDSASSGGNKLGGVTTNEVALAALYPLRPTPLAGIELHYAKMKVGDDAAVVGNQEYDITVMAPALGVRAVQGNWTIDAVIALLGTKISVKGSPALASSLQ